jgi:gamma-glutamylcyclotransferase (GGCT)/AIG2-like uncharacterized protein YtfP
MNKHLVFVYGSLRRGGAGAMSERFPASKFIARGKASGTLYDLGAFPGLLNDKSKSFVIGDVFEVDDETLSKLDDFEATSNYLRKQVEVTFDGDNRLCWVYVPDPDFYSLQKIISSGDWVQYSLSKTDKNRPD